VISHEAPLSESTVEIARRSWPCGPLAALWLAERPVPFKKALEYEGSGSFHSRRSCPPVSS